MFLALQRTAIAAIGLVESFTVGMREIVRAAARPGLRRARARSASRSCRPRGSDLRLGSDARRRAARSPSPSACWPRPAWSSGPGSAYGAARRGLRPALADGARRAPRRGDGDASERLYTLTVLTLPATETRSDAPERAVLAAVLRPGADAGELAELHELLRTARVEVVGDGRPAPLGARCRGPTSARGSSRSCARCAGAARPRSS